MASGTCSDLFAAHWFGSWGPWLRSIFKSLGIILLTVSIIVLLMLCGLSETLNACLQPSAANQMVSLHLGNRNKMNNRTNSKSDSSTALTPSEFCNGVRGDDGTTACRSPPKSSAPSPLALLLLPSWRSCCCCGLLCQSPVFLLSLLPVF